MNINKNKLAFYFNKISLDALLISKDFKESLNEIKIEELTSDINLMVILEKLKNIKYGHYIKEELDNLKIIVELLKRENPNNEIIDEIINEYENVKDTKTDEKVYLIECFYKVMDSSYLKGFDYIESIDKENVKYTIEFDNVTIYTLINDKYEIYETDYYICSIKKFLIEFPEMFKNKKINKRALEILEKNKSSKDAERLMYKIKNINKFTDTNFDILLYKSLYDYIIVQNMLNNNQFLDENIDLITTNKIEILFNLIDEKLIKDEKNKQAAYKILQEYKERKLPYLSDENKKELIKKINEYIGKLNQMTDFNLLLQSEYVTRLKNLSVSEFIFNPLKIDELIKKDLAVFSLYMFDDEKYKENLEIINHEKLYLSINKFINLNPSMFDDETVYKRTIDLLDANDRNTKKVKNKVNKIYNGR